MNKRLLSYLRSLGLAENANDEAAWEFMQGLRGLQANLANCLNHDENDSQARTNCDLMIRSLGYDPSDPAKMLPPTTIKGEGDEEHRSSQSGNDGASAAGDLEAARAAARTEGVEAEQSRVSTIRELAEMSSTPDELVRTLVVDSAITVDTARQRILEDHRQRTRGSVSPDSPRAPAGHVRGGIDVGTLQAAVLLGRNIDPLTQWAENSDGTPRLRRQSPEMERYADQGWRYRSASMADIVRECARIDGVRGVPAMGSDGLLQAYFEGMAGRAFSTSALSAVFTTNVNSELLQAFGVAEDTTGGGWIREADVSDFRTNERARMKNGGALAKLPRGGTADHASYEDIVESYKIARYASMFVIDDQDIKDDNFGGISGFVPSDMGTAARLLRADLVYSILMGNPDMRDDIALFHASHANLNTSHTLAIATLGTARKAMRIQQETSRNLNVMPKFLIVPPALEDTAYVILTSELVVDGTATGLTGHRNPNARAQIEVVADARLENGVVDPTDATGATTHSGSATTWFLASTANNHTIEVGYLRGTGRVPQIRPFVLDRGQWGLGWDVKMDIGAKALDWLGLSKATA